MEIDWKNLGFGYMKTDYNIRCNYSNGAWGALEVHETEYISLHMSATVLHYGQDLVNATPSFANSVVVGVQAKQGSNTTITVPAV